MVADFLRMTMLYWFRVGHILFAFSEKESLWQVPMLFIVDRRFLELILVGGCIMCQCTPDEACKGTNQSTNIYLADGEINRNKSFIMPTRNVVERQAFYLNSRLLFNTNGPLSPNTIWQRLSGMGNKAMQGKFEKHLRYARQSLVFRFLWRKCHLPRYVTVTVEKNRYFFSNFRTEKNIFCS